MNGRTNEKEETAPSNQCMLGSLTWGVGDMSATRLGRTNSHVMAQLEELLSDFTKHQEFIDKSKKFQEGTRTTLVKQPLVFFF